jgi:hypothetical protein
MSGITRSKTGTSAREATNFKVYGGHAIVVFGLCGELKRSSWRIFSKVFFHEEVLFTDDLVFQEKAQIIDYMVKNVRETKQTGEIDHLMISGRSAIELFFAKRLTVEDFLGATESSDSITITNVTFGGTQVTVVIKSEKRVGCQAKILTIAAKLP